ncbi:hypothetical protein MW887_002492 [Aspergillus wentii]|nr:hypothetical protein MW887_002492 [Aspergillus wentii]
MNETIPSPPGWVDEPDGRGTWGILSTCILTIILCCWTSVFPNIRGQSDGPIRQLKYKFDLACIGLLGPEFLLMLALGQWSSARASVEKFRAMGYKNWTLSHAFFADMGGFVIEVPGMTFPIDAEQLYRLIEGGYIDYPHLDEEDIKDKSKSDGLTRLIAILQALWFSINCILRAVQHLALTTLELTTLSFIIIFLVTSYCWHHKPMDISRPITLSPNYPLDTIRSHHHQPLGEWYQTPLSFLSRDEWFCSRFWRYYVRILHYLRVPLFTRPRVIPYDRIPSDNFPRVDVWAEVICAPAILLFSCMFLFAWNFSFPSSVERVLWRVASVYTLAFGLGGGIFCGYCHKTMFPKRIDSEVLPGCEKKTAKGWLGRVADKLRNIHPDKDPELEIPLRVFIPLTMLCSVYCVCRGFILVEDIIGLRKLPDTAFDTVSWSKYIPHW